MTRRISIPDDHVALVISNQLADELMSLLRGRRQARGITFALERAREGCALDADMQPIAEYKIAGDIMLALLEAKEA